MQDFLTNCANVLQKYGFSYLRGAGTTLLLALVGTFFGCLIGFAVGALQTIPIDKQRDPAWKRVLLRILRVVLRCYVELFRGTPMIVQALVVYFGMPQVIPGFHPTPFMAGIITLSLNAGAYLSEIFRSGIQAVPRGQTEAARSLGLSAGRTTVKIVLPQAFKIAIPPMVNQFIITLKDTSILTIIGLAEIVNKATQYVSVRYDYFATYVWVGIFYLVFTSLLMILAHYMEKRLSYDRKGSRS